MSDCVYAWTAPSKDDVIYPEFVNISVNDGKVEITVRAPQEGRADQLGIHCGDTAKMTLPVEQLVEMINMPFRALQTLAKNGRLVVPA